MMSRISPHPHPYTLSFPTPTYPAPITLIHPFIHQPRRPYLLKNKHTKTNKTKQNKTNKTTKTQKHKKQNHKRSISSERINGSLAYLRGSLLLIGWIYALKQFGWSSSDYTGSEHSLELRFLNHTPHTPLTPGTNQIAETHSSIRSKTVNPSNTRVNHKYAHWISVPMTCCSTQHMLTSDTVKPRLVLASPVTAPEG